MVTTVQRSLLIILLLLTAINLAGHITAPSSCCTVQENPGSTGDTDCLVCTLQLGIWVPNSTTTNPLHFALFKAIDSQIAHLGLIFSILQPPIA